MLNEIKETLNLKIIKTTNVENIVLITGFSPLLHKFIKIGSALVNVQIAITQNKVVIGYPLILHSY